MFNLIVPERRTSVCFQLKKMSNKVKKDDNENDDPEDEEPAEEINGDDGKFRLLISCGILISVGALVLFNEDHHLVGTSSFSFT